MTSTYQLTLEPVTLDNAEDDARQVLDKAKAGLGFIPNMYAGMANAPGMLDTYLHGYALFREKSGFTPAEQEVVFLTISRENSCHYCVAAHSMLAANMSKVPADVIDAIRDDSEIADGKLRSLSEFTREMFVTRGRPSAAASNAFLSAGFSERHMLEIVLALAVKTLSNYANHLFETPVDDMFASHAWQAKA